MKPAEAVQLLKAIVARERKEGCPEASERLIEPALRRWRSYERRFRRHKDQSLEHRAHDLEKGLLEWYPDHGYDPGCVRHLAQSFAEALARGAVNNSGSSHTNNG